MFVLIISILIVVLSLVYDFFKNKRKFDLVDKFPGPKTQPIVGNAFNYVAKSPDDIIKLIIDSHQTYGESYRTNIYNDASIWTCDLKIISAVLSSNSKVLTKSSLYNYLKPWIGEGLLTGSGKKWRAARKHISPIFHTKYFDYFLSVFSRNGEKLVKKLKSTSEEGKVVDIISLVYLTALDSICEIGFGEQIDALNDSDSEYVRAVTDVVEVLETRFSSFWTKNDILFKLLPSPAKDKYLKTLGAIKQFSNNVILKRRAHLLQKKSEENSDDEADKKIVFVDFLLEGSVDGKSLADDAILDQINTLTFNGRTSSPVAISFVLYALSKHNDIQQKLFNEIKFIFGSDKNDPVTTQQLQELPYLDCVIKEAMRVYPPIRATGRYIEEDILLDDGRIIPADSSLALTLFVAFRNPSIFPEPNEFNPDRFDLNDGVSSKIDPFAFIPFSSGPRNCIGQKYALLLIKTIVVQVLRNYEVISKGEDPILFPEIVLRSKNGVQIGLKNRVY